MPLRWPVRARLYWSPSLNTPLLRRDLAEDAYEVPLPAPGDYRLAFPGDLEAIREGFLNEFGSDKLYWRLVHGRLVVVSRVAYMDEMKEVVVNGGVLGKVYYDPAERRWRFRVSRYTARIAVEEELLPVYRLKPGERLKPITPCTLRAREGSQVVIVDPNGEPVAVGYYRGSTIHLQTRLSSVPEPLENPRRTSLWDVLKANMPVMVELVSKARALLSVFHDKLRGKPVAISFSGGKDSLVALHLAVEEGLDPIVVFNDTGLELPETHEFVRETVDKFGLRLEVTEAGDAFWRAMLLFGPPARDYRWCSRLLKLAPMAKLTRRLFPGGALNIVAQRAFESIERARTPRVWRNRWFPQLLNISPIQYWCSMAVWLYIAWKKLSYNKLYDQGFERVGCYLCPQGSLADYATVARLHPDYWERWERVLEEWRRKLGLPREWVTHGLWRWHRPHPHQQSIAARLGLKLPDAEDLYARVKSLDPLRLELEKDDGTIRLRLARSVVKPLKHWLPVLGAEVVEEGGGRLVLRLGEAEIAVEDSTLVARGLSIADLADVVKLVYMYHLCLGCSCCQAVCPATALTPGKPPRVDEARCNGCRLCIDVCPVANDYVESNILPALLGVEQPPRTRRRAREVVEKAKKLYGVTEKRTTEREPTPPPPGFI